MEILRLTGVTKKKRLIELWDSIFDSCHNLFVFCSKIRLDLLHNNCTKNDTEKCPKDFSRILSQKMSHLLTVEHSGSKYISSTIPFIS